tara:strand:+ start:174 stop:374 length:201 start_codon:yes stop_codon:yes gene_type:complete
MINSIIHNIAIELIDMFPEGVSEESCYDSANAYNYFPEDGVEVSADDIWEEVNKLQNTAHGEKIRN